ncbi:MULTISPECIES: hypothetical protein [unclassified Pantoea]|uniref:hypothetical protein n=1 Tax=unclassified Pantoea TaxID=2630326 RepID=UPI001CD7EEB7|nr:MULTISPECIES: hypothetical protein [unclassified Pantoea]MCA1177083.1 hypothetical protein [Pantoea sp. alder69]MCA1250903.1 hypothetical protein [Pantoea sp. alder70]MCA1265316.1 hypothetical protein [Pantoea sp. alder81]
MPVNLNELPEPKPIPLRPKQKKGVVLPLLITLLIGLVQRYHPHLFSSLSPQLKIFILIAPLVIGVIVFSLRLRRYENQREYAEQWNGVRNATEAALIDHGQQPVLLLDTAYHTPLANHNLVKLLSTQQPELKPIFIEAVGKPLSVRLFLPSVTTDDSHYYGEQLTLHLKQVLASLDTQRFTEPCYVRVRHNETVGDMAMRAAVGRTLKQLQLPFNDVVIDHQGDGLMWIDSWLDGGISASLVLSIEIELQLSPVAESSEVVSAALIALPHIKQPQHLKPVAAIHRPNRWQQSEDALPESLLWGHISQQQPFFVWLSQLSQEAEVDAVVRLNQDGYLINEKNTHHLDRSLGKPLSAAGNMLLICASEQFNATHQPQLVMLQDKTAHSGVIREYQQG